LSSSDPRLLKEVGDLVFSQIQGQTPIYSAFRFNEVQIYLRASAVPKSQKPIFAIICKKFLKPILAMPQDKN
jgi:hypothetical protein